MDMQIGSLKLQLIDSNIIEEKAEDFISAEVLKEHLGCTDQFLDKELESCHIFFIQNGIKIVYPKFFIDPTLKRQDLNKICKILKNESSVSKWLFLTNRRGSLGGVSPIDALRENKFKAVKEAALGHIE
ncbi:MAG TPA: hypothetical protein VIY47_12815 [Ignavibacteriaceae bacterium]